MLRISLLQCQIPRYKALTHSFKSNVGRSEHAFARLQRDAGDTRPIPPRCDGTTHRTCASHDPWRGLIQGDYHQGRWDCRILSQPLDSSQCDHRHTEPSSSKTSRLAKLGGNSSEEIIIAARRRLDQNEQFCKRVLLSVSSRRAI